MKINGMRMSNIKKGLILVSVLLLTACSAKVKVNLYASANSSLDSSGRPLSVVVRIYQLTETRVFSNASFKDLWKNDLKILGSGLLSRNEIHMIPNSNKQIEIAKQDKVKFVGVVALFRRPKDGKWRVSRSVRSGYVTNRLNLSQGFKITLRNSELYIK